MNRPSTLRRAMNRVEVLVVLAILLALSAVLLPGIHRVREAASRTQSQNNLKQIGTGIYNIASVYNCLEPPVVGKFPKDGPSLSLFFHLVPHLEANNLYAHFATKPGALTSQTGTVKVYCASGDPTNPGTGTLLTSYAANAAIFGLTDGGTARFPQMFEERGSANAIVFVERYGVVGSYSRQHNWPGVSHCENYLYPPSVHPPGPPASIQPPEFGTSSRKASDDAPQAFLGRTCNVLLADGSTRTVSREVGLARVNIDEDGKAITVWAWACCLDEPYGKFPVPSGW